MPLFHVTTDQPRVPAARFVAADLFELGDQVASHLARHKHLTRGIPYDAEVGDDQGAIFQSGLRKPITFTIRKES